jgi:glycosyltransferase involved in cell wall biosynthesis
VRILMLSKACLVGTYQRKLEEIAGHQGVALTVAVPLLWQDERGELTLERVYTAGYDLVVEPMRLNGHFHLHYYPHLGRLVARVRPDLVHIDEEPYNLATAHAMWVARRAGARTLFFSWQNLSRRYPVPFRWLERYVLQHADYAIVGNQAAVGVWRDKGYSGPMAVIPQFGIDPGLFVPPREPRDRGRGFVIGFVGRLVPEKGLDLLLQAVAPLVGLWRLLVCGSGPERGRLERQARELGIGDRVSFDEWIPSTQMPAYYQQLDTLVVPSRTRPNWKEQFGRVLVEGMACGVPVVGSNCGEIPNVIGDAGFVFPEDDAEGLSEILARLQAEPALRQELGRKGRQRVVERYTQSRIAAQTVGVYREMLATLA